MSRIIVFLRNSFINRISFFIFRRRKFTIERRTIATNIPYYVTENFHEYQGSLGRLEATVEDEYKANLRYTCNRERNYSKYPLPNCFIETAAEPKF